MQGQPSRQAELLPVIAPVTRISFAFGARSCGLEADGLNELVKVVDDALIEAVELGPVLAALSHSPRIAHFRWISRRRRGPQVIDFP